MSRKTSKKKPKIKAISVKYNFSIFSKNEIDSTRNTLTDNISKLDYTHENFLELKTDISVINVYYLQRLPIELARIYLNLPRKSDLSDNEIVYIACIKHQKEMPI